MKFLCQTLKIIGTSSVSDNVEWREECQKFIVLPLECDNKMTFNNLSQTRLSLLKVKKLSEEYDQ